MANFFEQFHDAPEQGAPAGTANYFSQFHPPDADRPITRITVRPSRPDNGMGDALVQGVKQGATAGFSDELQGLSEAGGAGEKFQTPVGEDSLNGIQHLLTGFAKYLAADPEAHAKYNATVEREREAIKAAEEHHPVIKGLGEVGGAIATLPFGGEASQAAGWTARALAAAKQGAVYGGLTGAGEGEGAADSAIKAGAGTVLGGVVGGVAAPLVELAGKGISAASQGARNKWRGAFRPDEEAARQYATMYKADRIEDPGFRNRLTPDEFHANPDARLMDLGGGGVDRLANRAAIESPGGEMKLKNAIGDRYKGQTNRFTDWFQSHFNYPDAYGQGQALDQVAKNVNGVAYRKAYQEGDRPIMSAEMEKLMGADETVAAMKAAASSVKGRAVTEGYGAFNPAVKVTDDGRVVFNKGANGTPTYPNLQFWDQTRRELSDAAKEAARKGRDGEASVLGKLATQMNAELDKHVSSYKAAREGASGFFGADNALQAGKNYVSDSKMGISEARDILGKMSPAERRLFQDGFVDEYLRAVINKTGDSRDVLLKIAENPGARQKLELAMGPEKMKMLEAKIRVEQIFQQIKKAVTGQSITAKNLYDLGVLGGGSLSLEGGVHMDPKDMAIGAIVGGMAYGGRRIRTQVATKLVDMMLSRDPMVVEKGFKLISSDPKWLGAVRDADTKIGRVFSEAAPTNTALQLTGAVHADDQKPGVPRPVNK